MAHPYFDRLVNPISTGEADYAHHNTCLCGFSNLPRALTSIDMKVEATVKCKPANLTDFLGRFSDSLDKNVPITCLPKNI